MFHVKHSPPLLIAVIRVFQLAAGSMDVRAARIPDSGFRAAFLQFAHPLVHCPLRTGLERHARDGVDGDEVHMAEQT